MKDRFRPRETVLFLVLLVVLELALGYWANRDDHNNSWSLIMVGAATIGLAWIDFYGRSESSSAEQATWYRRLLPFWCVVPFICVLAGSAWTHYQKWQDAMQDVRVLARDIEHSVGKFQTPAETPTEPKPEPKSAEDATAAPRAFEVHDPTVFDRAIEAGIRAYKKAKAAREAKERVWRDVTTEDISAVTVAMKSKRFPADLKAQEADRFVDLARVVGNDLLAHHGYVEDVVKQTQDDTLAGFVLAIGVQALFVLWVPVLLAVSISRAKRKLERRDESAPEAVRPLLAARDLRILAEDVPLFIPRLCFATLLVLGTNYVFSPFGLKTTYLMSIVDEHALPAHTSVTLWTTSFSEVPVIVVGFVGFMVYALITSTQRFVQDDLDDQSIFALLVRGLVVVLLSFALSSMNDTFARSFVFIAGVFPIRALEAIAKKANVSIDPDFSPESPGSFDGLPSLDPVKVFALRAAGIQSAYDLAAMRIDDVARRVRIDPRLLGRAVDRSILIDAIGLAQAKALEPFGITSATELVAAKGVVPEAAKETVGDAARLAAERLSSDPRVETVKQWLAGAVAQDKFDRTARAKGLRAEVGGRIDDQIRNTLLSTDMIEKLQGKHDIREVLEQAATVLKGKIEETSFITVDLSQFGVTPTLVQLPYATYDDFNELTDDIYYQLQKRVPPYEYGKSWALKNLQTGQVIQHQRQLSGQGFGKPVDDTRSLEELGIHPGQTLQVMKLP